MNTDRKIGMLRDLLSLKPSVRNYAQISMLVESPSLPLELCKEYRKRMEEDYLVQSEEQLRAIFSSPRQFDPHPEPPLQDFLSSQFVYMKRGMQEDYGGIWDAPSGVFHYLGSIQREKKSLFIFEVIANEEVLSGE